MGVDSTYYTHTAVHKSPLFFEIGKSLHAVWKTPFIFCRCAGEALVTMTEVLWQLTGYYLHRPLPKAIQTGPYAIADITTYMRVPHVVAP
jgi:hypothetical protein